jgi:hypothetical protein
MPAMAKEPPSKKPSRLTGSAELEESAPRKLIEFDPATLQALQLLARDSMKDFQELADEAFADLLKKHNRPVTLKEALRASAGKSADVVPFRSGRKKKR